MIEVDENENVWYSCSYSHVVIQFNSNLTNGRQWGCYQCELDIHGRQRPLPRDAQDIAMQLQGGAHMRCKRLTLGSRVSRSRGLRLQTEFSASCCDAV